MAAKEELGLFDLACAKVVEAHKLMNEARELVKQDLDNFKEEKSAFEKLSKTQDKVHFGSAVNNNNNNLLLIRRKYLYEYIQMRLTSYIKIIIK